MNIGKVCSRSIAAAIIVLSFAFVAMPAGAQSVIHFSSPGTTIVNAPNGSVPSSYEMLAVNSSSGNLTLTAGVPVTLTLNDFSLENSSTSGHKHRFVIPLQMLAESFTINGIEHTLSQRIHGEGQGTSETINLEKGSLTTYDLGASGMVEVTLDAQTIDRSAGHSNLGSLKATFLLHNPPATTAPEPSSLLGLIVACVGLLVMFGATAFRLGASRA